MYTVIDLFAGAGGLSLGFLQQGDFEVIGVVENNESALETYKHNHTSRKLKVDKDIRKIDFNNYKKEVGEVDVIIGGPPCQGFSNANRQKTKFISMNNSLVKRYADAILTLKPKAFVMENVAMLRSNVHKFFDSEVDHDEIEKLCLDMKEESYVIMNCNPDGVEMLNMLSDKEKVLTYCLRDPVFNAIKLIHRYIKNEEKLKNYFNKYSTFIVKSLTDYKSTVNNDDVGNILIEYVSKILEIYINGKIKEELIVIDKFIEFVRAINLMKELYENQVIFKLEEDASKKIIVKINTYTVFDYLKKRIGSEYKIVYKILNAKDFGAPQERKRFIMLGLREDISPKTKLEFPCGNPNDVHTVRDAIEDLENYTPSKTVADKPIKRNGFSHKMFTLSLQDKMKEIHNHVNTDTRDVALQRFKNIEQGKNFHSLDKRLKENTYSDPTRTQNTIYLRLEYDKPCGTVVNVRKSMWIHPTKDRAISIREAARLQTFPDSYIFYGTKDSQYQQIGNAVPPILAKAIADKIYSILPITDGEN